MTARATSRHTKEVYTGLYVDYDDIQPGHISIEDIAHGLAHTCRFGGHTKRFYSVAEHAILVSSLVLERARNAFPLAWHALHHDDHEAYLGDLPTPLKNRLGQAYTDIAAAFDAAICEHLGLTVAMLDHEAVHRADAQALRMESHMLMPSKGEGPEWEPAWERYWLHDSGELLCKRDGMEWRPGLRPEVAKRQFLSAHERLAAESARYYDY